MFLRDRQFFPLFRSYSPENRALDLLLGILLSQVRSCSVERDFDPGSDRLPGHSTPRATAVIDRKGVEGYERDLDTRARPGFQ